MVYNILKFMLVCIFLLTLCSGCRFVQPIVDAIFQPPSSNDTETVPPSPSSQLWKTVKKSNWITTLAIPIIALGAVAMFNGAMKLGMSAIIFGAVNLFMALATARFAFIMAVFGLIGSTAAVAISILVKQKALKEVVGNVQDIKDTAKVDNVDLVFQDKVKETLTKQAKSTKKLVSRIKNKLSNKKE